MFDLNNQVIKWRQSLSDSETFRNADIDELESHLREEIEQLTARKLSEQEAFWVAAHRLGDTQALAGEFAKVNTSARLQKRLFWILAGVLFYLAATYLSIGASRTCAFMAAIAGIRGYTLIIIKIVCHASAFVAIVLALYKTIKKDLPVILFFAAAKNLLGKIIVLVITFLLISGIIAAQILPLRQTVGIVGAEEYGRMMLFTSYARLALQFIFPLVLVMVLFRLSRPKSPIAQTQFET